MTGSTDLQVLSAQPDMSLYFKTMGRWPVYCVVCLVYYSPTSAGMHWVSLSFVKTKV